MRVISGLYNEYRRPTAMTALGLTATVDVTPPKASTGCISEPVIRLEGDPESPDIDQSLPRSRTLPRERSRAEARPLVNGNARDAILSTGILFWSKATCVSLISHRLPCI